jgi:glyoxylase-like metal-dependent hydrolase (beta-lactamase superfamily II)
MINVKVEVLEKESVQIYRMATLDLQGKPFMWVSAYLIDGLLIDCGHHHASIEFLKLLNHDILEYVVLSHHHEDHFGACNDLITKFNVPVYATKETAFLIRMNFHLPPERRLVWGTPAPTRVNHLKSLNEISTSRAKFKIIPSPGHCCNLISFYHKKKRLLFSTDSFIDSQQSVIFNWENANEMLETFKNFKRLKFKFMFLENGDLATPEALDDIVKYWTDLKFKSHELYHKGYGSKQIVKKIFGKESVFKKMTGGDLSRENLIRSLLNLAPLDIRYKRKKRK